jgi:hypothetical protein
MEASLPLNRRAALKLGLGGGIGGLFGFASARAEDRTREQQRPGTNVNMGPRTDPPPLVDARFPCEIAEDVWVIPDRRIFPVPNIGIVVGKEAALAIDCGLGPVCGREVSAAASHKRAVYCHLDGSLPVRDISGGTKRILAPLVFYEKALSDSRMDLHS